MNRVTIEPTKFHNQRSGEITFGFRMYDDEGQSYDNTWESIPDDDLEVLDKVMQSDDFQVIGMLDFLLEHGLGLNIGNIFYAWDNIKHLWGSSQ